MYVKQKTNPLFLPPKPSMTTESLRNIISCLGSEHGYWFDLLVYLINKSFKLASVDNNLAKISQIL